MWSGQGRAVHQGNSPREGQQPATPRPWDDRLQSRASSSVMKRATTTRSLNPHSEAIGLGLALAVRRQIHTVDRAAKGHGTQAQTIH